MSVEPIPAETQVPRDWSRCALCDVAVKIQDGTHFSPALGGTDYKYVTSKNIGPGYLKLKSIETISAQEHRKIYSRCDVKYGDLLFTKDGANTGNAALSLFREEVSLLSSVAFVRADHRYALELYLLQYLLSGPGRRQIADAMSGNAITRLTLAKINNLAVPLPPIQEQRKIVSVLTTLDDQIGALKGLIAKKEAIKQGIMQQLLTGETRLPGFAGKWSKICLGEFTQVLNNLRVPLSAGRRLCRPGPFPYCGANGVLDYIDDYLVDDDVILLAEDGGNFDQFYTRPIAYRMKGKIWVNNHAHVLKAASGGDTGYLFYALAHKDIRPYISSSTRSKLTRGELVRIEVALPGDIAEQQRIAEIGADADNLIFTLKRLLTKMRTIKQGMVQELLTGRTRLPIVEEVTT
jgi:type I restriction enzyme S subunit